MKNIICLIFLFQITSSNVFSQSVLNYQSGSGVDIQPGADVCADQIQINGTFSGGGTICGGIVYILNLSGFIEGFYNKTINKMINDTIRVYLRNAASPYAIVDSSKSKLDSNGYGTLNFTNLANGANYYLVLKHRNSIETWSNTVQSFASNFLSYDFTTAANKAYGNNQIQIDNSPLRFGIYGADVNQDGVVDATDNSAIDNDAFNFVTGYVVTDLTGDNFVDAADAAIADNNAFNFVTVERP